jgi:hypothetical protein
MKIVIPSHNRSNNVLPLDFIPESYYDKTYIVTRKGEQEELYSSYKEKVNVLALDCDGISSKRDQICRHFDNELIWMLDDDCLLYNAVVHQVDETRTRIKITEQVSEESFYEFIEYCTDMLKTYPHGIVRPALFARPKTYMPYRLNMWAFTNAMLNLKTLSADDLEYNYSSHSEDVVAFLNTIEKGYQSFCLSKWMVKSERPGKPGGMTEIRTANMITEATQKIHSKFPDHTKIKSGYPLKDGTIPQTLVIRPKKKPSSSLENFMEL